MYYCIYAFVCLWESVILSYIFSPASYKCVVFRFQSLWLWELLLMWEERNLGDISEGCCFKGIVACRQSCRKERRKKREVESPSMVIYHVCDMMVMTGILNGRGMETIRARLTQMQMQSENLSGQDRWERERERARGWDVGYDTICMQNHDRIALVRS